MPKPLLPAGLLRTPHLSTLLCTGGRWGGPPFLETLNLKNLQANKQMLANTTYKLEDDWEDFGSEATSCWLKTGLSRQSAQIL